MKLYLNLYYFDKEWTILRTPHQNANAENNLVTSSRRNSELLGKSKIHLILLVC